MPDNPNMPVYSAADLLRYATGRMPAPEMYTLEKAALEDPFLAEAIEGYRNAAEVHTQPVLQKSIDRLNPIAQKEERKIITLWSKKLFQYAAAAIIVFGGGWLTYALINQTKENNQQNIASAPNPVPNKADATDTSSTSTGMLATESTAAKPVIPPGNAPAQQAPVSDEREQYATEQPSVTTEDKLAKKLQRPVRKSNEPAIVKDSEVIAPTDNTRISKDDLARKEAQAETAPGALANSATTTNDAAKSKPVANRQVDASNKQSRSSSSAAIPVYVFHGRITDEKNNPLPYANVMINGEDIGTYTDSKGSFNFIYDDSLLPVRTRSLGYESQTVQLKTGNGEQQIIMPEDEKLKESLALTVPKRQAKRKDYKPMIVETDSLSSAKPVVSLFDYNTYLLNNNRVNILPQTGSRLVELSFEVDKRGELKNITVEQSSGKERDDEAIRLLKEGPKWKSINNNGRARVKVKL